MASPRPTEEDDQSGRWSLQSVRPIYAWEKNEQALDCRRCNRWFNLLIRRHHCRRCGLIVCDRCSTNRVMLPYSQIVQDPSLPVDQHYLVSLQPQRVCDVCFGDLSKPATRLSNRPSFSGSSMHRSISMQSVMMECPVCGKLLSEYGTINEQEQHVQSCLNAGTSAAAVTGSRYLVYILAANSALVGQECVICFEEFEQGDTIARLSCLCSYHRHCIHDWFSKGKECPVHSR
ncbi:uncharacterized protein BYT42DRAFT_494355 [Radiomyces spectabilis]|uniref:uncharacterized protein n=1 Tax=Radiomyces spectabilis TaxID=64574 RepID=UPI00221EEC50|nr:uncharacterized protein BYT42DRAFT_494355 [Radiomyces spectabilis]KAI8380893.1 hypothetical protein BYT42DRAFT_494355 [Radiomyces spectabilis]